MDDLNFDSRFDFDSYLNLIWLLKICFQETDLIIFLTICRSASMAEFNQYLGWEGRRGFRASRLHNDSHQQGLCTENQADSYTPRPFKVDCLFCIPACVASVMTQTKTQRAHCSRFLELRPFFGLKICSVGAEKNAFKVFHSISQPAFRVKHFPHDWELQSHFPA